MADIASEGSDGLVTAAEVCRVPSTATAPAATALGAACDGEDMAVEDGVDEKVSIHEILEGMTNEFNKGVSPTKHADNTDKTAAVTEEAATTIPSSSPSKIVDETSKVERECDGADKEAVTTSEDTVETQSVLEDNHKGDEEGPASKQEIVKKDNGIPRIVLTFRTIDENTDHGKKTKISSCSSNLTLVPDELANCDQIGGVSVKIENSDDNSDVVEESQAEEVKEEKPAKEVESQTAVEDKVEDTTEKVDSTQPPDEQKPETTENNPETNNVAAVFAESTEQQETTAPVTRKRRIGRPRLRALRFFLVFLISVGIVRGNL